jgi:DNA repair protein RecO (recombination protein O)
MPTYRANAIVLKRLNYGETDRILTLYTREHGRLSAIAKGCRRPISRLAAATELFTFARYMLATGRSMDVVAQPETRESFPGIRSDMTRIAHATYIVEMVNETIEDREPNPDLFDSILSSLYLLEGGVDPELVTRAFELQLMDTMGYRPHLHSCARCGGALPCEPIRFSPSTGGIVCGSCGTLPDDVISIHRKTLDTMTSLLTAEASQLRDMKPSRGVMHEMANAMRWYIRYRLERELKSSEFIQALKAGQKALTRE